MRLYSVQPRFVYDALLAEGRFLSQPYKGGDEWIFADAPAQQHAYDWLCKEMHNRGLARPGADIFPIWAWRYYDGIKKPKPDLRGAGMKAEGKDGRSILLSLDVPDEEVVLHDFDAWHYPLNHFYIGTVKANSNFERRCKKAGCPLYDDVPLKNQQLREEIEQSWKIVFDLAASRKRFCISEAEQRVQATFWELRAEHVVAAVEFGSGFPKRSIALPRDHRQAKGPR